MDRQVKKAIIKKTTKTVRGCWEAQVSRSGKIVTNWNDDFKLEVPRDVMTEVAWNLDNKKYFAFVRSYVGKNMAVEIASRQIKEYKQSKKKLKKK